MDIQLLIPSVGVFLTVAFAASGMILIARGFAARRVRSRLQDVILVGEGDGDRTHSVILRDMDLSTIPFMNEILKHAQWAQRLDNLLVQGDIPLRLGSFIALMGLMGSVGALSMTSFFHQPLFALPVGLLSGSLPLWWARYRKQKRLRAFERQFPDALDMLVGALRAGLALTGAIQVVADESPDPVGREFGILSEENRLGLDLKEALKKLGERVDSQELHLFVTAVILQRETGGNLAEILEGTAAVIRDRFRILGDVRSLTAHARLSGSVLMLLPLAMAGIILTVAPDYLKGLLDDPAGKFLIGGAIALQVIGLLVMRRIINIKV
jgi:tight adherence protein B